MQLSVLLCLAAIVVAAAAYTRPLRADEVHHVVALQPAGHVREKRGLLLGAGLLGAGLLGAGALGAGALGVGALGAGIAGAGIAGAGLGLATG